MTSRRWHGTTAAWRRVRLFVLQRDGYRCQLRLTGCTTIATQVHHTAPREVAGDDPAHLLAACAHCNNRLGDPSKSDPQPRPSRWA